MTHGVASGFTDQGELVYENLIAGEFPRAAEFAPITGSGLVERGSVLGKITLDGRFQLSDASATDGSQIPSAILAQNIDVTAGDADAVIYLTGDVNELALVFGPGHSAETVRDSLRDHSIFLRKNLPV